MKTKTIYYKRVPAIDSSIRPILIKFYDNDGNNYLVHIRETSWLLRNVITRKLLATGIKSKYETFSWYDIVRVLREKDIELKLEE